MPESGFRHSCLTADLLYQRAAAVIFFDAGEHAWVLVHTDRETWEEWDFTVTVAEYPAEHPLRYRRQEDYSGFDMLPADFCLWCGLELATDPAFVRWQQSQVGAT